MLETTGFNELKSEKSFDVLASIKLYQYDIEQFGVILPETRARVYDEELSYIAEGIDRPLYTEFNLHETGGELAYFHNGQWRSYIGSLIGNLELAKAEAAGDPRRQFLAERAAEDLRVGYQIAGLQPGEQLAFQSDFPQKECDLYGEKFIGEELGFQPARKMGFIYQAEKTADGRTVLRSQTVDGNDPEAYAAAMDCGRRGGGIEAMLEAYDNCLRIKHDGDYYAGRRRAEAVPEDNAWAIVTANKDLIEDYFLKQVERLSYQNWPAQELERAKKRLTYGTWAALKERLDSDCSLSPSRDYESGYNSIQSEVESAYATVAARGEVMFGCGGSIAGENAVLEASAKDVFESIFGKKMSCPFCGASQYGDPCSPNQFCKECTAEVKNRRVVSRGRGRRVKKGFLDILGEEIAASFQQHKAEQAKKQSDKLARSKKTTLKNT